MSCLARNYGDQMVCAACSLTWDLNDPERPDCRKVDRRSKIVRVQVEFDAEAFTSVRRNTVPLDLPYDVAAAMCDVHDKSGGGVIGMQAAYRVMLDKLEL